MEKWHAGKVSELSIKLGFGFGFGFLQALCTSLKNFVPFSSWEQLQAIMLMDHWEYVPDYFLNFGHLTEHFW